MSDAVILGVVAMVCVAVGGPTVLAVFLGRKFACKASETGIELTAAAGHEPTTGRRSSTKGKGKRP